MPADTKPASTGTPDAAATTPTTPAATGTVVTTPTTEPKAGDTPAAASSSTLPVTTPASKDGAPAPKAPDKYVLTVPESAAAYVAPSDLELVEAAARTGGWTQEEAQDHVNDIAAIAEQTAARYLAQTKADPDIGGDKFEVSTRLARSVIDRVRPDGHARREPFLRFLNRAGAGNNVEVIAFLADLGRQIGEDGTAATRSGSATSQDAAQKLYDNPSSRALDQGSR